MEAACVVVRLSVLGWVSLLLTELAIVTDRPSRTQAVPRPRTRRVWNGDQRRRSRRAGIVLRIGCCCCVTTVVMRGSPRSVGGLVLGLPDAGAVTRDEHDGALGFEKDVLADRP